MVFGEAKKLGSDEIEELRQRVDGPFKSPDTDEERQAMKERVIAKGEKIMRERSVVLS